MQPRSHHDTHALLAGFALLLGTCCTWADVPTDAAERAAILGQPTKLAVWPDSILLADGRSFQQVLITGHYADGKVRDLTPIVDLQLEGEVAALQEGGMLVPVKDGTGQLVVKAGSLEARIPLTVKNVAAPHPVSFRTEVIAALNVGGCNAGACHGTPSGKNGFKLSLRGYDPDMDFVQLTRDVLGRRTSSLHAEQSLLLQKAVARVPHEGGQRFPVKSVPYRMIHDWMAEGLKDDPKHPAFQKVEVLPGDRVQHYPARWQQLAVVATLADGTKRDVTPLSVFTASDPAIAGVTASGFVEFKQPGEVAILVRYLESMITVRLTHLKPRDGFAWTNPKPHNFIDELVFAKLKLLNILPSDLCSDQEFLRRSYVDVCGVLPTAEETKAFLESKDPDKRRKLVDQLLDREEYADFWTLKWADVLRSSRKTIQHAGVHKFQDWLRNHVAANDRFDDVVRELLTASGSTYANPPTNFFRVARDPTSLAETTAQLFFGIRMQCCKCHNHPFERWTQDDYYSLAAFFARVKQKKDPTDEAGKQPNQSAEWVYLDRAGEVVQPRSGKPMPPRFLGGDVATVAAEQDRRDALASWLIGPNNPFFAKATVNRIWYHLVGRGIVDPVDDFRDSNPASNEELLDRLAKEFVTKNYDLKHVMRLVLNSRTYQVSAQTNETNKDDNKYFSRAVTRLHTAEQLLDALCSATAVPEKFPGLPLGTRATQLPDGEVNHVFLKTFGQPARELACECERESDSNLAQALQLINGPTIHEKLKSPNNRIGQLLAAKKTDVQIVQELYLATLSRLPVDGESQACLDHVNKNQDKRRAWEDVQWALVNSKEFLFRH